MIDEFSDQTYHSLNKTKRILSLPKEGSNLDNLQYRSQYGHIYSKISLDISRGLSRELCNKNSRLAMQVKATSNEFFPFYGYGGCHMQEQPVGGGQTLGTLNYLGSSG
jgi:hypothetical protein